MSKCVNWCGLSGMGDLLQTFWSSGQLSGGWENEGQVCDIFSGKIKLVVGVEMCCS